MHPGSLRALEFDRIVEVVRSLALTPLGEARLARLAPLPDAGVAEAALAVTSEAARFLVDHPGFPLRAPVDLEVILEQLSVDGVEHGVRHSFLRARANSIEGGTSEIMRNILGEQVLGLPGEPRVDKELPWSKVPRS